jgi:hypothetical protein
VRLGTKMRGKGSGDFITPQASEPLGPASQSPTREDDMKTPNRETVVGLILPLALFGCAQKPTEEPTQSKAAKGAPAVVTLTVPTGTELDVRLITGLNSKDNKAGDVFDGTLETPVVVGEKTVIPKGAEVAGKLTNARQKV